MRKKYIKILMLVLLLTAFKQICFGISEDFEFIINTIGIPRYNVLGDEINEEIYYTYNVFSYSDPVTMSNRTSKQRFKQVPNKGKWTQNGGSYESTGIRGEYDILGTGYSGNYIYNVYFPVDSIPETLPDKWRYITIQGASDSWKDKSKFKYSEQLDYMKNVGLLFDTIDYSKGTADPYNLVEYKISANMIGLDKVVLNTSSTWKTYGVVSVNRINDKGQIRYATFATKPMAASANVSGYINSKDRVILDENSDEIIIKIEFGTSAINLNNYARKDHIKEIYSDLYINNNKVSNVTSSKVDKVSKTYLYKISRSDFEPGTYTLNISSNSYLYTEFSVDGLMRDKKSKNITIQIEPKRVVPIEDVDVKVLEKHNNIYYIKDMIQTKFTKEKNSKGIIEKEKHMALNLKKGNINLQNKNLKVYIDEEMAEYTIIKEAKENIILDVKIPSRLKESILGWEKYRENTQNYFNIDFDKIGNRISNCNRLKLKYLHNDKEYIKEILFDTIDSYKTNINFTFENNLLKDNYDITKVEEWKI